MMDAISALVVVALGVGLLVAMARTRRRRQFDLTAAARRQERDAQQRAQNALRIVNGDLRLTEDARRRLQRVNGRRH